MSLYLELGSGAVWGTVLGKPDEITMLEDTLNEWALQVGGRPAWLRSDVYGEPGLVVMGGVVPLLVELGATSQRLDCPLEREKARIEEDVKAMGEWLWEHQADAVRAALLAPLGRGIIEVPTGGGKTRIAAALGAIGGGRWLYVVPNKELLAQAEDTFREASELQGDSVEWHWTTYSQLYNEPEPGTYVGAVFDEVHRIAASTWAIGAAGIHRADYRIGLSGTPLDRTDDKNTLVIGLTGPVVFTIELKRLQEMGRLACGEVEMIEVKR